MEAYCDASDDSSDSSGSDDRGSGSGGSGHSGDSKQNGVESDSSDDSGNAEEGWRQAAASLGTTRARRHRRTCEGGCLACSIWTR